MSVYSDLLNSRGVFSTLIGCEVVGLMLRVGGSTSRLIGSMPVDCGLECVVCHLISHTSVVVLTRQTCTLLHLMQDMQDHHGNTGTS